MKYLKISNQIEIEPNAFHLIGACTKRGDSTKIGYFGSGLKYAIATLLRNDISFDIYSGLQKIEITTLSEKLRDMPFDVICINGQKTSMTLGMGPEWKAWQAIREIYCNALDETDGRVSQVNEITPVAGETSFYILLENSEKIQKIVDNWDCYFAHNRTALVKDSLGDIYERHCTHMTVYRKEICCYADSHRSLFDYNFVEIPINESRLAQYSFYVEARITVLWKKCATSTMIERLVDVYKDTAHAKDYYEHKMDYTNDEPFNDNWIKAFEHKLLVPFAQAGWFERALKEDNSIILPMELIEALKRQFEDRIVTSYTNYNSSGHYMALDPTKKQEFLLKETKKFLSEVGIEIKYPVVIAKFEKNYVMGEAHDGKIILSDTLFDQGRKKIVTTLIEEHMHLDSGCTDETRGFQDHLINQMVTMLENQNGVFL